MMGASMIPPNALEQAALGELDSDKLNDLAECLFVLNNRRYGPIAGAYMVVCVEHESKSTQCRSCKTHDPVRGYGI